jgi:hypothetical protein
MLFELRLAQMHWCSHHHMWLERKGKDVVLLFDVLTPPFLKPEATQ